MAALLLAGRACRRWAGSAALIGGGDAGGGGCAVGFHWLLRPGRGGAVEGAAGRGRWGGAWGRALLLLSPGVCLASAPRSGGSLLVRAGGWAQGAVGEARWPRG